MWWEYRSNDVPTLSVRQKAKLTPRIILLTSPSDTQQGVGTPL